MRMADRQRPVRTTTLQQRKQSGPKITVLTAYDATMARILDSAGIDVLLVGDSLGTVIMGESSTIPVTMDIMLHHTRAVVHGTQRALVVADLPFLSAQISPEEAIRNAGRLLQEGGAAAVKLEGGREPRTIEAIVRAGIPVMGHLGLIPQYVHQLGGYGTQGRTDADAARLIEEAVAVAEAGAFAVVLESIPAALADEITKRVPIPTIGIGAGPLCDGQVLVSYDAFGLYTGSFVPPFAKVYARLGETMADAAREFIEEVRAGSFPAK
jgi:3-methyl-2-oxobutanoate hydroxymethyltransferase